MIHFFPKFENAANSPYGLALRELDVPFRIFDGSVSLGYRSRITILLLGYPRLVAFAVKRAWQSIFRSDPYPEIVVLGSDVEVLVFSFMRLLSLRRKPAIAFVGFIYTTRRSWMLNWIRSLYYRFVLSQCEMIVCHSRLEVERYARVFPGSAAHFVFVPWGSNVPMADELVPTEPPHPLRVLAAGRSGRDYPTLARAVEGGPMATTIVCDAQEPLDRIENGANLRILRKCYGIDYLKEIRRADVVVIPLSVDDISAGQMVMIQAMAFAKAIVITRTPTISEYLTDGVDGLMVPLGEPAELRRVLLRLNEDATLRQSLGQAARQSYLSRYSQAAFMRNMVETLLRSERSGSGTPVSP